jgi:hypothetical protein
MDMFMGVGLLMYITTKDRHGASVLFPVIGTAIGGMASDARSSRRVGQLLLWKIE